MRTHSSIIIPSDSNETKVGSNRIMTPLVVEAIYENGVLRPAQPLPLKERQRVEVVIRTPVHSHSEVPTAPPVGERQEALERLLSLELPVADWEQMEQEIIRGAVE